MLGRGLTKAYERGLRSGAGTQVRRYTTSRRVGAGTQVHIYSVEHPLADPRRIISSRSSSLFQQSQKQPQQQTGAERDPGDSRSVSRGLRPSGRAAERRSGGRISPRIAVVRWAGSPRVVPPGPALGESP